MGFTGGTATRFAHNPNLIVAFLFISISPHHPATNVEPDTDPLLRTYSRNTDNSPYPLEYTKTQRGRDMLIYAGYRYVTNRQSAKNKFWRCSRYVKYGCRATIVTSRNPDELSVRLAGMAHSHGPEMQKNADNELAYSRVNLQQVKEEDDDEEATAAIQQTTSSAATAVESDSDGGIGYDLMPKSLFQHSETNEFFVIDMDCLGK